MEHLSRRLFLQVGVTALPSFIPHVKCAEAREDTRRKILPLVIFFQGGAQSAFEFVSPLSDSPRELRGDNEIIIGRNGMPLDSRWPKFADVADQTTVIRSLDSGNVNHDARPVVGQPGKHGNTLANGGLPNQLIELPSTFSDLSRLDDKQPMHIQWSEEQQRFTPPEITVDTRIAQKMELLYALEKEGYFISDDTHVQNRNLAASLLSGSSDALHAPFRYSEHEKMRYGNHPIGDACALASGFAQSGGGVTVVYNEFDDGWDMHSEMDRRYEELIPPTDHALRELILDSRRHGFILLMTSEHGRTPIINANGGRDHGQTDYAILSGPSINKGLVMGKVARDGSIFDERVEGKHIMTTALEACGLQAENRGNVIKGVLQ